MNKLRGEGEGEKKSVSVNLLFQNWGEQNLSHAQRTVSWYFFGVLKENVVLFI